MTEIEKFIAEKKKNIVALGDEKYKKVGIDFINVTQKEKYSYNFSWMGRPVIQFPQDIVAMQEIIWNVKPDLIVETGIAHGGSLIMYASFMEMMGIEGEVLGVDIDIREYNRKEIENHPMFKRITMFEGSSISNEIVEQVKTFAEKHQTILVVLDSNHTHDHVLKELELYSDLVSIGSYCVVFDTIVEDMHDEMFTDRPWGIGNNPKTAVLEFLKGNNNFVIDNEIEDKLLITVAPDGYLKRIA